MSSDWLFVNHTAYEYLFGYNDPLLEDIDDFLQDVLGIKDPQSIIPSFIQLQSNETGISFLNSTVLTGKVWMLEICPSSLLFAERCR
jgi:hypothetical protein